jgi:predicted RecB family nuclease
MATVITREVLESHLNCRYKSYLKLAGQRGSKSVYEEFLDTSRLEVKREAINKILALHTAGEVARNISLTAAALQLGPSFVLDATLEDDQFSLVFDGLKRVDGPSKAGDFRYIPMLFVEGRQIRKEQRLLMDIYGIFLSHLQAIPTESGIIWHGKDCRPTKVRLSLDPSKAKGFLEEIRQMQSSMSPPRLTLNDHCRVCEFRQYCRDQAVQEDNISLLRGMREKEVRRYARKGILTVTQLAHTFRPVRRGKRAQPKGYKHHHALQALAIRDKMVYLYGTPQLRSSPVQVYLDVEGCPDDKFEYLIGMIVVEGGSEQRYSFWADDRGQEDEIFEQFLSVVARYDDFMVFCFGSYEKSFLTRMRKRTKKKKEVDRVLKSVVNTLSLVYTHFYFPTYSNGLKDLGECLRCTWTEPGASGVESIAWRMRWQSTHERQWKDKLTAYNLEDCVALRKVTEFIYAAIAAVDPARESRPGAEGGPALALVEEIDRLGSDRRRGRVHFFHPDFEHISHCAHFDYQRQRVFVRTSKVLKKNRKRPTRNENKKLKVGRYIEIISDRCPECGGTEITRWSKGTKVTGGPRVKRVLDLAFTSGGIKRRVIECRAPVHECVACGVTFMPERYKRLAKHTHNLMSWSMHERVRHRISLRSLRDMFHDFFGLLISGSSIHEFQVIMACYYRSTYNRLLKTILSSNVLHVDETTVKLQNGKGYVWVFTNLEEVVFMYRPTREGAFLQKLLKNFHGVLISDFYSAYDSIKCPQQKCLIHLIRDMNEDLLNNPFDEELQAITGPFAKLLREIVVTIDQHGLKQCHLKRHEQAVANYFVDLAAQYIHSGPAAALRERLTKYKDKLFTFLRYDGVPWNNNNAENAVKQFVYYREHTDGIMRETRLNDYLVLLSICQTCKYKGISFLKFLLSKERDMDAFVGGRRAKRSYTIELYPKGFTPQVESRSGQKVAGEEKPLDQSEPPLTG